MFMCVKLTDVSFQKHEPTCSSNEQLDNIFNIKISIKTKSDESTFRISEEAKYICVLISWRKFFFCDFFCPSFQKYFFLVQIDNM